MHLDDDQKYNELQLIQLQKSDDEYSSIYAQFMGSAGMEFDDLERVCIYKVNHEGRSTAYTTKRQQILKTLGDDRSKLNELTLYHGTSLETIPKILHQGFLRQFTSRAVYGKGVYFARDAEYSCSEVYAQPDADGFQHLLLCQVVCGEWTVGSSEMVQPPMKTENEYLPYETTVNNTGNPSIFVTYQDDQALPTYLISFKPVASNKSFW